MLDVKTMKTEIKKVEGRIADLENKRDNSIADLEKRRDEAVERLNVQIAETKADYKNRISETKEDFRNQIGKATAELKHRNDALDRMIAFEEEYNNIGKEEIKKPVKRKKKAEVTEPVTEENTDSEIIFDEDENDETFEMNAKPEPQNNFYGGF